MTGNELSQMTVGEEYGQFLSEDKQLVLRDTNFSVAFQINNFITKDSYEDENMVQWIVKIAEGNGHNYFKESKQVGVHKCTEKDWATFSPPKKDKKERIEQLKKANTMFCLNQDELQWDGNPLGLFGSNGYTMHRRLEIRFLPCQLKNVTADANEKCSIDLTNKTAVQQKLIEQ